MKSFGLNAYFLCLLGIVLLFSCSKDEKNDSGTKEPSNLTVEISFPYVDSGLVRIQATAENATGYSLHIGSSAEPVASNASGTFEYFFTQAGTYDLTVRAYGTSGRYISANKVVVIKNNNPVTIDFGYTTPMQYPGYQMVWNDEFTGSNLNTQFWTYETGAGGWGNSELQYYRQENTTVTEGVLTIEARMENFQGSNYTSSRLITRNKKTFTYGRVDIRALLPKGQGIWPALWTLGNNITNIGWPACGEIDIMEMIGGNDREKTIHGTLHWDNNGHAQSGSSFTKPSGTFTDEYHVFTILWDQTSIRWYINDILFNEIDISPAYLSEFHQPHFFIFNLAVGGIWPGNPDFTTRFPQQLKVDYIRVFQKN